MSRQLWSQSVGLLTSHVFCTMVSLAVTIYALRHWGPTYSGVIAQAQSLVGLLAAFSTLGLETSLARRLVQHPAQTGCLLGSTLGLRLIGGVCLALILVPTTIVLGFTSRDQILLIFLAWCALTVQNLVVHGAKFSANQNLRPLIFAQLSQAGLFALLRITLLHTGISIYWFQATYALEAAFSLGVTRWLFRQRFSGVVLQWDAKLAWGLFIESLPVATSALFITAFLKIDVIIVSLLLSSREVGIYSAAMKIVETYMTGIAVLFSQSMVWLAECHIDRTRYEGRLLKLFRYGFVVTIGCLAFNVLFGQPLFRQLLGPAYEDSVSLSNLLGLTLFATTAGTIRAFAFSLDGLNRYHLWSALIGLSTGIPLTVFLTSQHGLVGTCVALVIAYTLSAIGTSLFFPVLRPIGRMQLMLPPYAAQS